MKADLASERTCIVTKTKAGPDAMIRFVLGPDARGGRRSAAQIARPRRLGHRQADAVAAAVRSKAFARGFKAQVKVSASLPDEIETLLNEICLQALSLAKKAGQVVAGFFKAEAAIKAGSVIGLIHASDGGSDGSRKLSQALRRQIRRPRKGGNQTIYVPSIEFGTRRHKCDTCSAHRRGGERGVSFALPQIGALSLRALCAIC